MPDKDQMTSHLDNAMYGPPKLHPDEQRTYLGTFRERVSLLMSIQQLQKTEYLSAFQAELNAHPDYQVIFNGHTGMTALKPYLQIAGQLQRAFTIVQDDFYGNNPTDSGLVVVSKTAINQYPIKVEDKTAQQPADEQPKPQSAQTTFWTKMKKHLGL
ncbi:YueI family protein [Secundilactobacillus yichangensis]|uniref:YueI family protein n=1 Tax=Secundilactobacillus yichangensis TaxID=2799580 RepID=UPI001944911F|nr:YueI family protein [Secundilactobacillus yichangensis]